MSCAGRALVLTALAAVGAPPGFCAEAKDEPNYCCLSVQGSSLSATAVAELEKTVAADPKDLAGRILLTGYYSSQLSRPDEETLDSILQGEKPSGKSSTRDRLREHMLWIIRHQPGSEAAAYLPSTLADQEPALYEACKAEWLKQTKRRPKEAAVFAHAAKFVKYSDNDSGLAIQLMGTARRLEPACAAWAVQLADIYELQMRCLPRGSATRMEMSGHCQEELSAALAADPDGESRFHTLPDAAGAALEAGHPATASAYACEALAMTGKMKDNWYLPIALHKAWTVLGGVALAAGRTEEAKTCLLASGRITHNDQSSWFGPNLALASDLSLRGERKAVVRFLDLCMKWDSNNVETGQLKDHRALLNGDRAPDFGLCLSYY